MFREIIFIVSGTRLLETSTSIVERKILFNKFKRKEKKKNPFPTTLGITFLDLNLSQTIIEARFIYIYISYAKKSSHPNKSSNPTYYLLSVSKPKIYPKAAFPNSPTCLNLSKSPTNHQSKNSKIPQSSPSQTLSLSNPNLPQHLPLQKRNLPWPLEINDAPESFSQTFSNLLKRVQINLELKSPSSTVSNSSINPPFRITTSSCSRGETSEKACSV